MVIKVRKLGHHHFRVIADCFGTVAAADERNLQAAIHAAVCNWWGIIERTDEQFKPMELRKAR